MSLAETKKESSSLTAAAAGGKASVVACYIVLANNILGSGMLGLPYAYSNTGWVLGTFLIFFAGTSSAFALHFLAQCAIKRGVPSSFYSVAEAVLPSFTVVIDAAVAIKCFGVATSYLIVIGDTIPAVMEYLDASDALKHRNLWISLGWAFLCVPLSCLRRIEMLKFTSFLSIVFVFFLAILVVIFSFNNSGNQLLDPCQAIAIGEQCRGDTENFELNANTGKVFPIFVFGFTCQQNIFSIVNELSEVSITKVNQVVIGSIGTAIFM